MSDYTLAQHGDPFERHYESLFISRAFPSYERFWQRFVVPLTNRPIDIRFKTPEDLNAIGKGDREICIAQLHYSILRHLGRVFDLREPGRLNGRAELYLILTEITVRGQTIGITTQRFEAAADAHDEAMHNDIYFAVNARLDFILAIPVEI